MSRPKKWKLPVGQKNDSITKVSFSNKKNRLFIDNISHLIDYTFSSPDDIEMKGIWHQMMMDYGDAMKFLRKCSDYTKDDITSFQLKIDDFFKALETHGNLYKYSQQGWESLNEKVKLSFFNHMQHGGNYGAHVDESERSYLKSIFMFFSARATVDFWSSRTTHPR